MPGQHDLTALIHRAQAGDAEAADALFRETYAELREMARSRLRGGRHSLLDTTALVSEWFVRFAHTRGVRLEDRGHFLRYAGAAMRTIIVDAARRRGSSRRGGDLRRETLDDDQEAPAREACDEILAVHQALDELARLSPRMADVVELRYFGGLTELEAAEALQVTDRTVRRDWDKARLWLAQALAGKD